MRTELFHVIPAPIAPSREAQAGSKPGVMASVIDGPEHHGPGVGIGVTNGNNGAIAFLTPELARLFAGKLLEMAEIAEKERRGKAQ